MHCEKQMKSLMNQKVKLVKQNDDVIENIPASVQKQIFIMDIKVPIEEGDIIEYILPSNIKRTLSITKVNLFNAGTEFDH